MRKAGLTKHEYQQMIAKYVKRREHLREQHGKRSSVANPEYRKAVQNINKRLCSWRRAIKRIDERQQQLGVIDYHLKKFFAEGGIKNVRVRHSNHNTKPPVVLARKLFYKFCLENGFSSPDIMYYVSGTNPNHGRYWATEARRQFTRSFKTNLYHKNTWDAFMVFMKHRYQPVKQAA